MSYFVLIIASNAFAYWVGSLNAAMKWLSKEIKSLEDGSGVAEFLEWQAAKEGRDGR